MDLFSNSFAIFLGVLLLLLIAALLPFPSVFLITSFIGALLIVIQAVIILKDKP